MLVSAAPALGDIERQVRGQDAAACVTALAGRLVLEGGVWQGPRLRAVLEVHTTPR